LKRYDEGCKKIKSILISAFVSSVIREESVGKYLEVGPPTFGGLHHMRRAWLRLLIICTICRHCRGKQGKLKRTFWCECFEELQGLKGGGRQETRGRRRREGARKKEVDGQESGRAERERGSGSVVKFGGH
jgi:hypothetical protein